MRRKIWPVLLVLAALCAALPGHAQAGPVQITIINTSDEHGWLQPFVPFGSERTQGGAANIVSWWKDIDPAAMLLLSGGDNWTGPSISTWFQGEPMVQAFNLMGYDASAVGNHEFDFGREILAQRMSEADYPYLAANIQNAATGELADFVRPYTIFEVSGVQVGVIGLALPSTPSVTNPRNVTDLDFTDPAAALETYVPQLRQQGAEIVVVLSHICMDDLAQIARETEGLVDAMFAGHCNELGQRVVNGVPILGGGWAWRSYAMLTITYDPAANAITALEPSLVTVEFPTEGENPVEPDPELAALVDEWQARADEVLAVEIGYTASGIVRQSWTMANWVMDAWLWAYPTADIAVTNFGGFRQDIPAGPVEMGDIVGMLPFENRIYEVTVTGAELAANLECCGGAVGGIRYARQGGEMAITFLDGREFDPGAEYQVLINDFMYFGGDGYLFGEQDPAGYDTGIQWRQPVIDWTLSLETTPDDPLEDHLDAAPRGD
jgi:2',3'-cyclic-nucleotide 2'-phosphodiesterase (5'-nucleotidase family)